MFGAVARRLFGTSNERQVRSYRHVIQRVNAHEEAMKALPDSAFPDVTATFKARVAAGESLDDLLPEAFAAVREAARRTLGQRHFDTQLLGGAVLHSGKIAEMKTGEGKTLVATLPVYLNALSGKGVHVVTVNDYLARRDAGWMSQVYGFLGLTTGIIVHGLSDEERRQSYLSDITYGTNNEFGFDYLRDNMKYRVEEMVQRAFNFAIVDEVDSILIDEARTPLIISGPAQDSSELYRAIDSVIPQLEPPHYEKDEKQRSVALTEAGTEALETWLADMGLLNEGGLYDVHNVTLVHHAHQALRAHKLFTRDVDYIVKDDKVVIIDEFTGRMMPGRRYSDGLHQALEAKEKVEIQQENQTLASITFQNYFRMYPKLGGMTGTAMTEAAEFGEIYKLDVVEIPTHRPIARIDHHDEVYRSVAEKYEAIATDIAAARERGQPVLVGTVSIEKSEMLSAILKKKKIPHQVLNARHHEQEASIVAQAGIPGAVTIATNMAGRGTDIQLGGNLEMRLAHELGPIEDEAERETIVQRIKSEIETHRAAAKQAGGLYVIGTERHESRRIDNQLRGRSGRQGDPGASKFFLSLEDDLMRIFGSNRMGPMLSRLGMKEGEAIIHPWINKALEKAQSKVEAQHFEVRKNLLKYDDVMNDQRRVIYDQRRELMTSQDVSSLVRDMREDVIAGLIEAACPANAYPEQWDVKGLHTRVLEITGLDLPIAAWAAEEGIAAETVEARIEEALAARMAGKAADFSPEIMRQVERSIVLQVVDQQWKDHLLALDHLRQGINLRAYGQRDPLNEYKREAFALFDDMLEQVREQTVQMLAQVEVRLQPSEGFFPDPEQGEETRFDPALVLADEAEARAYGPAFDPTDPTSWTMVPRNAPCPCGSGQKFKHCHGRVTGPGQGQERQFQNQA